MEAVYLASASFISENSTEVAVLYCTVGSCFMSYSILFMRRYKRGRSGSFLSHLDFSRSSHPGYWVDSATLVFGVQVGIEFLETALPLHKEAP